MSRSPKDKRPEDDATSTDEPTHVPQDQATFTECNAQVVHLALTIDVENAKSYVPTWPDSWKRRLFDLVDLELDSSFSNLVEFSAGVRDNVELILEPLTASERNELSNYPNPMTGETILFTAITINETYVADVIERLLMNCRLHPNAVSQSGLSIMHVVAFNGKHELVRLMVIAGAAVDPRTPDGRTPLFIALQTGQLAVVVELIFAGADVNAADMLGRTPRLIAIRKGPTDAKFFARVEAHVAAQKCEKQRGALEYGMSSGEAESAGSQIELGPLHAACMKSNSDDVVRVLKEDTIDVNASVPGVGVTCLMIAAYHAFTAVVRVLLEHGASISIPTLAGENALDIAVRCGHAEVVEAMLPHANERERASALHVSAEVGDVHILSLLVKFKSEDESVDAPNALGEAPLTTATKNGRLAAVETLLKAGANVNAADLTGCRAIHFAASRGDYAIVQTLLGAGADVNAPTLAADPTAQLLGSIATGTYTAETEAISSEAGCTPLHCAVSAGHPSGVADLLAAGADANAATACGATPLHYAAAVGDRDTVLTLIAFRASAAVATTASGSVSGSVAIAAEQTPEDVARAAGHTELASLLAVLAARG